MARYTAYCPEEQMAAKQRWPLIVDSPYSISFISSSWFATLKKKRKKFLFVLGEASRGFFSQPTRPPSWITSINWMPLTAEAYLIHNIADSDIMADDGSLCTWGDKYLSSAFLVLRQEAFTLSVAEISFTILCFLY